MNAFRRRLARFTPLAGALFLLIGAAPAIAADECISISAAGEQSSTIFADGFVSGDTSLWNALFTPAFDLAATGDLVAEIVLDSAIAGDHLLELRWKLANGQLYQSVTVPFTVGAVAQGAKRMVPGYPFPVAIAAARPVPPSSRFAAQQGATLVSSALPVAGTQIVESGLSGLWHLEAYLDESETPCGAAFDFQLVP